jgi:phage tail-like protein
MAQFVVNAHRRDPYKNFKFQVRWDGRVVAGVSRVSGLRRVTDVIAYRHGNDSSVVRKAPGLTRFEPITLERGVTHDPAFEQWANKVWSSSHDVSLADYRKDVVIDLLNEAGQLVKSYVVHRAWPSAYQALPDLDAGGNAVALESLVLEHEGWERDEAVAEPAEPSY